MGKSIVPIGKKRFYLTLTEDRMIWLQEWFAKNGYHKSAIPLLIDDMLLGLQKTVLELEKTEGAATLSEIFSVCTKTAENLGESFPKK